jgi:hypothetical protein
LRDARLLDGLRATIAEWTAREFPDLWEASADAVQRELTDRILDAADEREVEQARAALVQFYVDFDARRAET